MSERAYAANMPNSFWESIARKIEHKMIMPAPISGVYVCASGCLAARRRDVK